ncbi:MAG TPA: GNAT family N-acetyltransferase [Tepidiformaceae bacterium]|nr:GNAT family N-acetyltransferase [Tepidiformaceae bacterium]
MDPLTELALRVNQENLALGNEVRAIRGGRLIRNREFPILWDANHVDTITASTPEEVDGLLDLASRELSHASVLRFDVDNRTPAAFEARLILEGFGCETALVSILEGDLLGRAPVVDIRVVQTDADWDTFAALKGLDWEGERDVGVAMAAHKRGKTSHARYWFAWEDGAPRGFLSSWEGIEGVGQVEDLFVEPGYRNRGLATALLHNAVADCREHGAEAIVIVAAAAETPKQIYARMGWRPIATKREYRRAFPGG